jgi:hypothetical protein
MKVVTMNGIVDLDMRRKIPKQNCFNCVNKSTRDCPYWGNNSARKKDEPFMPKPPTCFRPENKNENI